MLSNFFNIPFDLAVPIFEAVNIVMNAIFEVTMFLVSSLNYIRGIGYLFLIPVAISFIFVAIKFIRSVVWVA